MATASGIRTNLDHLNYLIRENRQSRINDGVLSQALIALEQLNRDYNSLSLDQKVELHGLITLIQQSNIGTDLLGSCSTSIQTNIVQDVALKAFRKQVSPKIAAAVNTLIQNGINGYRLQNFMKQVIKDDRDFERITQILLALPQDQQEGAIQHLSERRFEHVTEVDDYLLDLLGKTDGCDLRPYVSNVLMRIEENLATPRKSFGLLFRTKSNPNKEQEKDIILFLNLFKKIGKYIQDRELLKRIADTATRITTAYKTENQELKDVCSDLSCFTPPTIREIGQASARAEEEIDVLSPDACSILRQIEENLPTSSLFSFTKPNIIEAQAQKIIPLFRALLRDRKQIENSNLLKEIVNTADRIMRDYKIDSDELKTYLSALNKAMKGRLDTLVAKERETKREILARLIDPNFNGPIDDKQQAEYKQHLEELKDLIEDMDFRFAEHLLTLLEIEGIDTRTRSHKDYKASLVDTFKVFLEKIKLRDDSEKIHILKVMTNLKIELDENINIHTAPLAVINRYTDLLIGFPFEKIGSALEKIRSLETRYQIIGLNHDLNLLILSAYKFIEEESRIDSAIQRSLDTTEKSIQRNPQICGATYFVRSVIVFLWLEETLSYDELHYETFEMLQGILDLPKGQYVYPDFIIAFSYVTLLIGVFSRFPPTRHVPGKVRSLFSSLPSWPSLDEVKEANKALLACIPERSEIDFLIENSENDKMETLRDVSMQLDKLMDSLIMKRQPLSEITEYLKKNRESIKSFLLNID